MGITFFLSYYALDLILAPVIWSLVLEALTMQEIRVRSLIYGFCIIPLTVE